jgi:hypothetical protein
MAILCWAAKNSLRGTTIIHSFILHHFPRPVFLYLHHFSDQQEKPLWGANPRIELGPAMQQADPLPLSHAIP